MKTYQHVSTGAKFIVIKENSKTVYMVCIDKANHPIIKTGGKERTSQMRLRSAFIKL